jgi:hypothetical protein
MGFVATVIAFERTEVEGVQTPECSVNRDGDETATGHHFSSPGDDAPPLPGDLAMLADDSGAGEAQPVGYQDPSTPGRAAPGEKRIYARSAAGVVACEIWLKSDGSLVVESASGATVELGTDGAVRLANGAGELAIDAAGNVTATTPLGTFGAATHTHTTPFGPSGPPITGT